MPSPYADIRTSLDTLRRAVVNAQLALADAQSGASDDEVLIASIADTLISAGRTYALARALNRNFPPSPTEILIEDGLT